jgi:hypothetical protein
MKFSKVAENHDAFAHPTLIPCASTLLSIGTGRQRDRKSAFEGELSWGAAVIVCFLVNAKD